MEAEKQNSSHVHVDNHKNYEELDVNSAVRKAIEKAQESIHIAMVSVGRKKNGLKCFSRKRFNVTAAATSSQGFPDFLDGKKLSIAKMVMNKINEKLAESIRECSDIVGTETTKSETDQPYKMFVDDYEDQNDNEKQHEVLEENENGSKDDHNIEIQKEGSSEMFCDDCVPETETNLLDDSEIRQENNDKSAGDDDNVTEEILSEKEESIEKTSTDQTASDVDEYEENLHDNCEIKQEDNITVERKGETLDESCEQEFNEKTAGDDEVSEETNSIHGIHAASNIVVMNENTVKTTQDVAVDVTEASGKFQTQDTEAVEEEFCAKTSMEQTAFVKDEYEVTDVDESNKQKNIIHNLEDLGSENNGNTNESKDSQESKYRDKEDETEEPGPSEISGQDHFRRIYEEAAAKERERVKNKLAIERAVSEARDRASAEDRERAERQRAAVKEAIEEVKQRMISKAHETVAKAKKSSSADSKPRAERAAVERSATSEARQRPLAKAMFQKTLQSSESALRTKAKLDKHNKIMERAAKGLAEKEKRDRLAQKEQAERNPSAENLDAEIKRWANGKEGNLCALLSTLEYILGPESGWQPISLAHIMTTSDIKKAYRKATLCVHPEKLQQRGASIQHKYICEKVFDLLKAAWKRFNSEER